ncbi:hypothetical protein EHQ53_05810 [Leptospira langatensis]|uniref:Cysteine-rich CWC family protein n=1 Tax=Leptospira langatensis TaxID=2484983 RepID=A0A5F1ZTH1_9LEPT|nr:hypothetical protein EHO57_06645 [Leptospira langatensis]TGL41734.1 hypothetical protein EHQ53_05810 [Leptospira langatensis]
MTQKQCPSCSRSFECGVDEKECWCFNVSLDEKALQNIREMYENCLCRECLTRFETNIVQISN